MKLKKIISIFLFITFLGICIINIVIIFHAYNFTHFSSNKQAKTKAPNSLSFYQKLKVLAFGVSNPRPNNTAKPTQNYQIINLQSNKNIECWLIKQANSQGTVILFHGYGGNKSLMLDKAAIFNDLGYSTLLVDFAGSGGSESNETTIGFNESLQVKTCYDYMQLQGEQNIILFGTSMGAVAMMKSVSDYNLLPTKLILECPFGTMLETVKKRCENMKIPSFPFAHLLVFWGGVINNFNGYSHNPTEYAKKITISTLLLYGEKDKNVTKLEINTIFNNLQGQKFLKTYQNAGHENYLIKYKTTWKSNIHDFLTICKVQNSIKTKIK